MEALELDKAIHKLESLNKKELISNKDFIILYQILRNYRIQTYNCDIDDKNWIEYELRKQKSPS